MTPSPSAGERACRECGCTYHRACEGGCHWVEADLCSTCAGWTIPVALQSDHHKIHRYRGDARTGCGEYAVLTEVLDAPTMFVLEGAPDQLCSRNGCFPGGVPLPKLDCLACDQLVHVRELQGSGDWRFAWHPEEPGGDRMCWGSLQRPASVDRRVGRAA